MIHCDMSICLSGFPTKKDNRLQLIKQMKQIDKLEVVNLLN